MSKQVQFRRGTTAEHSTFTGAVGEVTVDTTKDTVVVHDGSTVGGFPLLRESAYTATDVLTKIKTVDGSGSGLDADLLDGQSSSYYATVSGQTITDTIMSKAAFNALASERRANRAGSGFDEFGKTYAIGYEATVNDGMHVNSTVANSIFLGRRDSDGTGISKTYYPLSNINGVVHKLDFIGDNSAGLSSKILLPEAPTIYPYDATLTTEQIASGVIKHADSSNSGLLVNGKFDTDTSGWVLKNGAEYSAGSISATALASALDIAYQDIPTVAGKKYIIEFFPTTSVGSLGMYVAGITAVYGSIGHIKVEFTSSTTTSRVIVRTSGITTGTIDNIAVFPADAISRSDLVFVESWHEDISEKNFVYPLGNVQYLGGEVDGLATPVAGAFSGYGTYSLFGNWQTSGALVGKGYVWSTLTDAQKKAFVSNPENNMYLDGDKVIQVRYRVRVVQGLGDSWYSVDTQGYSYMCFVESALNFVAAKGKAVSLPNDFRIANTNVFIPSLTYSKSLIKENGIFEMRTAENVSSFAYEGKCFALPIALINRRNQGGYNAAYNSNGTKAMTMTPLSISDCFNTANLNVSTGYIGTSTPRGDGLFYDQVSVEDFKPSNKGADLRNSSKKRTAQSLIEEFAPKALASTIPYYNNNTTPLTTYKDFMEVRDTSGNRYPLISKIGNVATIGATVANKKGFSIVTQNGKQYLQVAYDATSDTTVQMNLSTIKYDIGVFDA